MRLVGWAVSWLASLLVVTYSSTAQQLTTADPTLRKATEGQVAQASVGQVGQRQTREQTAPNTPPTDRIASRLQTRIQSRLRTRIDQQATPSATALTAFSIAEEEARTAGSPR
jgi:hypothetical protein